MADMSSPLDINLASREELIGLPGVGSTIADLEIAWQLLLQDLLAGPSVTSEDSDDSPTLTPTPEEIVEGTPEVTAEFTVTSSLTVTPTP